MIRRPEPIGRPEMRRLLREHGVFGTARTDVLSGGELELPDGRTVALRADLRDLTRAARSVPDAELGALVSDFALREGQFRAKGDQPEPAERAAVQSEDVGDKAYAVMAARRGLLSCRAREYGPAAGVASPGIDMGDRVVAVMVARRGAQSAMSPAAVADARGSAHGPNALAQPAHPDLGDRAAAVLAARRAGVEAPAWALQRSSPAGTRSQSSTERAARTRQDGPLTARARAVVATWQGARLRARSATAIECSK